MNVGVLPDKTCLSYKDGEYKNCLLSGFDSNKKIIYAMVGGKYVGRAIIRLTKGRFRDGLSNQSYEPSLEFVDLEDISTETKSKKDIDGKEYLTLFLETPYISGQSPIHKQRIEQMFIEMIGKKAADIGAIPVISLNYSQPIGYVRSQYQVYISQSKGGAQYFDSYGGMSGASDEGSYERNTFFILKDVIE